MQKLKHNAHLVIIIAILFVSGLSFASFFRAQGSFLASPVSADDDEGDREEREDDREDDSDNDRDEDENDREDEEENDNEDENDDQEERRATRTRTTTTTQVRTQEADDDDENEVEDEDESKNEDAEDLKELNEDVQKVESRINVLASNGVSVDAFRTSLAEIKGLIAQNSVDSAENKLERLNKLVKMSLKDDDEDEESTEEASEEISELKRDIAKIESRLSLASSRGLDVTAYRTILNDAKEMLAQAEAKLSTGNFVEAESLAELADKKLDRIDDIFEDDDEDEEDDAEEYKNEVALFVHNLKEIGEIEGGIGQQVRVVAQAQNDSQPKVESAINEVSDRNGFVKFLIGPKYESIAEVTTAITENQTRIRVLTDLANQMTDPAVKQVLLDQVKILTQQNTNLQKFVTESQEGISLFGWLMKIFA